MPFALRDLQAAFAAHLAGPPVGRLVESVIGDTISAEARLQVHRNHLRHSLCEALAATFPTVQALVGDAFFRRLATAYIEYALPAQPMLAEYGSGLPRFLAGWEPAGGLPYLADVARLDWALNDAWHAAEDGRLSAAALARLPAESLPLLRLVLSAGTHVVASPYPLDRIRAASQPGAPDGEVRLDEGVILLVLRQGDDATFLRVGGGEGTFLQAIADGETVESAAGSAVVAERDFDLSSSFARLLGLGCFAALQQ